MLNFIKISLCIYFFAPIATLKAQDKVTELTLDRDENFENGIYSKKEGFWAVSGSRPALKRTWDFTMSKYTPDLSKKEWEVKIPLGMWSTGLVYDVLNPKYLYYLNETPGVTIFTNKKVVTQISPDGKITNKEHVKDESLNTLLFVFCNQNYFCEVWNKDKSEDFALVKYEHETLKRTKSTIDFEKDVNKKEFGDWTFSSQTDSLLLFIRYGRKEKEGEIQTLLVNVNDGKTVKKLTIKPSLGDVKISPNANDRFEPGTERLEHEGETFWGQDFSNNSGKVLTSGNGAYLFFSPSAFGNIEIAPDGQSYYFYALVNFSGEKIRRIHEFRPEGFKLIKFDKEGRVLWSKQEKFSEQDVNELSNNFTNIGDVWVTLKYIKDSQDISLEVQYNNPKHGITTKTEWAVIGRKFDSKGDILEKCSKDFVTKPKLGQKATTAVKNTESLLPCYSKSTTKRVLEYIEKKGISGRYSVYTDRGSSILTIIPSDDKQVVGCLYFKD